jgi:RNA polymerase sigma-70 factor (ECF subfamily)
LDRLSPEDLLLRASAGDTEALGRLLEAYRASIRAQAENQLNGRLGARIDPSDIVQETFLEAHRDFPGFHGRSEAEWAVWLNRILSNNVIEAIRCHENAKKRSVRVEKSLQQPVQSGLELQDLLPVDQSTPGQRAVRREESQDMEATIESLPADQRTAIRLRYVKGHSLNQIAKELGRSERAAASLLHRAVKELQRRLAKGSRRNK